jgi:hypothetical protein
MGQDLLSECTATPLAGEACGSGCGLGTACDQTEPPQLHWRFDVPAWIPEMHGTTTVRGRTAPVNVSTREVFQSVDDLDFIFAARLEVDYERWGFLADGLYYNLGVDQDVLQRINLSAGFEQAIVDFAATYDIAEVLGLAEAGEENPWEFELLAGGRYNLLAVDQITITGPRGNSITRSGERDWVDPIVGGLIRAPLTEDFLLSIRGDVGGFGIGSASQFTWNVEALGEFRCSEHCRLMLGYRLLDIDQEQGRGDDRFEYDMQLRGPIARIGFEY